MRGLYIASILITILLILYKFKTNSKKVTELNNVLDSLKIQNKELQLSHDKLEKTITQAITTTKKEYESMDKKHTIIINSDKPVVEVNLPYKLKNVIHAELISGIIPKSQYRINQYNNNFNIDNVNINVPEGSYTDIISLLMTVNQDMYDNGKNIIFVFNSIERNITAVANTAVTTIDFSADNSCADVLGFEYSSYNTTSNSYTPDPNNIFSSLNYLSDLKNKSNLNNKAINNLPANVYTFTDQFYDGISINIDPTWSYIKGSYRVNMKHQLYVDIDIDEIQYWGGSHRLARIFIPENLDETEYTSYGNPIRRSLIDDITNIDKLTFRLYSVVKENKRNPYELNGLNYSLQLELTTKDTLLLRH